MKLVDILPQLGNLTNTLELKYLDDIEITKELEPLAFEDWLILYASKLEEDRRKLRHAATIIAQGSLDPVGAAREVLALTSDQ